VGSDADADALIAALDVFDQLTRKRRAERERAAEASEGDAVPVRVPLGRRLGRRLKGCALGPRRRGHWEGKDVVLDPDSRETTGRCPHACVHYMEKVTPAARFAKNRADGGSNSVSAPHGRAHTQPFIVPSFLLR
jgi:hypothetical protein